MSTEPTPPPGLYMGSDGHVRTLSPCGATAPDRSWWKDDKGKVRAPKCDRPGLHPGPHSCSDRQHPARWEGR